MNKKKVIVSVIVVILIVCTICSLVLMAKSNNNYIEYSSKDNMSQTYIGSDSVYTYNDKVTSDEEKVAMYAEGLGISGVMNKIILGESDEVDEFLSDSKYTTFYCIYNNGVVYYFVIDGDEVIQLSE